MGFPPLLMKSGCTVFWSPTNGFVTGVSNELAAFMFREI
jgi:hypothetical protein